MPQGWQHQTLAISIKQMLVSGGWVSGGWVSGGWVSGGWRGGGGVPHKFVSSSRVDNFSLATS